MILYDCTQKTHFFVLFYDFESLREQGTLAHASIFRVQNVPGEGPGGPRW